MRSHPYPKVNIARVSVVAELGEHDCLGVEQLSIYLEAFSTKAWFDRFDLKR